MCAGDFTLNHKTGVAAQQGRCKMCSRILRATGIMRQTCDIFEGQCLREIFYWLFCFCLGL